MARSRTGGFAMVDALVALLLLAVVLAGACATLVQSVRAARSALVTSRAVDLASDLLEQLRGVSSTADRDSLLAVWREEVALALPVAVIPADEYANLSPAVAQAAMDASRRQYELTLRWVSGPRGARHELRLPVSMADLAGSP